MYIQASAELLFVAAFLEGDTFLGPHAPPSTRGGGGGGVPGSDEMPVVTAKGPAPEDSGVFRIDETAAASTTPAVSRSGISLPADEGAPVAIEEAPSDTGDVSSTAMVGSVAAPNDKAATLPRVAEGSADSSPPPRLRIGFVSKFFGPQVG